MCWFVLEFYHHANQSSKLSHTTGRYLGVIPQQNDCPLIWLYLPPVKLTKAKWNHDKLMMCAERGGWQQKFSQHSLIKLLQFVHFLYACALKEKNICFCQLKFLLPNVLVNTNNTSHTGLHIVTWWWTLNDRTCAFRGGGSLLCISLCWPAVVDVCLNCLFILVAHHLYLPLGLVLLLVCISALTLHSFGWMKKKISRERDEIFKQRILYQKKWKTFKTESMQPLIYQLFDKSNLI